MRGRVPFARPFPERARAPNWRRQFSRMAAQLKQMATREHERKAALGQPVANRSCEVGGMIRHSVTEVIQMAKIEIYTQPWCPFCERAVHILSTKQVEFH